MIISITGHRPNGLPKQYGYNLNNEAWTKLKEYIEVTIEECYKYATPNEELTLVTGMALGVDTAEDKQSFKLVGKADQEKFFVGIDKRKTYIGIGIFAVILISFFSINSWFTTSKYESNVKASKAELSKETANDTAVTGNHLQNVPKDYKTLAEKEKLYKSQSGNSESYSNDSYAAKRNQNTSAGTQDRAVYSEPVTRSAPPAPYVPPRPSGAAIERKVDPAEEAYAKALEKQLELKAKANESPIRFELNKDN